MSAFIYRLKKEPEQYLQKSIILVKNSFFKVNKAAENLLAKTAKEVKSFILSGTQKWYEEKADTRKNSSLR